MAKKKKENSCESTCRMAKVGGQAVLDGVMMKSGDRVALSVRTDEGIKTADLPYIGRSAVFYHTALPMAKAFLLSSRNLAGTTASRAFIHASSGRSK